MWVAPESGRKVCGRPASMNARDRRRECATNTLSSGEAMDEKDRTLERPRLVEERIAPVDLGLLLGMAKIPLRVVGVVEALVGGGSADDGRVEHLWLAQHGRR